MAEISKEPAPGISEEERKKIFEKQGYYLRRNKHTGKLTPVKRPTKKKKNPQK